MKYIIYILFIFITVILLLIINHILTPKKRFITIGVFGFVLKIVSILINNNISDIRNKDYKYILDITNIKLEHFSNNVKKKFNYKESFEKEFWEYITDGKYYNYHKEFVHLLLIIANGEYIKVIIYMTIRIYMLPFIIYKILSSSSSCTEVINKLVIIETLSKAYQISSITNTDLYTTIKKMRFVRNIKIYDNKNKLKLISRQVRLPMVGSEVCPFIKYIKKCNVSKQIINYSILIIEGEIFFTFKQVKCDQHKSCVFYKYKNKVIKHLEDCDFWIINNYWEIKYPLEKEIII